MPKLQNIIEELIARKKEGEYYDFKQEHYENAVKLILKITCLANTVRHKGERYLIFGVADDFSLVGVTGNSRNKQKDIIDTLRAAHFASSNFPDIRMETLTIDNKKIDVIIIEDSPNKPYYLEQDKQCKGTTMRAGVIYARTQDTNTPINKTAAPNDIVTMCRQRFGLDDTPLNRFRRYLLDSENWKQEVQDIDYYIPAPEFTIRHGENGELSPDDDQEYVRGEIGYRDGNGGAASYSNLYFHQTLLKKIPIVSFDNYKKTIVAPDWQAIGKGHFYYYLRDSLEYIYQRHMMSLYGEKDHSKSITPDRRYKKDPFDIPVLKNETELSDFIKYCEEQDKELNDKYPKPETDKDKQTQLFYKLLDKYENFELGHLG